MLKRLELNGFKSFAERTAFDFGPGLTAVVGPNGSGKSNVIDAVRWVLGEQSARSLRGGEMADVIFNGSSTRRSLGMAEVSVVFDNRPLSAIRGGPDAGRGPLNADAGEVRVTRRVYRDGEGEYLINGRPCRLKDVKDLFLGSGAGAGAYCVIEQGRVDALLQASARDRRIIFEEAAGVSRFRARKTETLRKLEKAESHLARLKDIVDEVEKQLRSVQLQASKAERYQEYATRLRELRVGLGLREFHAADAELITEEAALTSLRGDLERAGELSGVWEGRARELDELAARLDGRLRGHESARAEARQAAASARTAGERERELSGTLEGELARDRGQHAGLSARVAALTGRADRSGAELDGVAGRESECRAEVDAVAAELRALDREVAELRRRREADRAEYYERRQRAVAAHNEMLSLERQVEVLVAERERLRDRTEQTSEQLASLDVELAGLSRAEEDLQQRLNRARHQHIARQAQRDQLRKQAQMTGGMLAVLREQRSGLASRVEVLENLERTHEGLGAGVREVVALLAGDRPPEGAAGLRGQIAGMVADVLEAPRDVAPLIDLALGDAAQRFLARDAAGLDAALREYGRPFAGRVSFLPVQAKPAGCPAPLPAGVVRADRLVRCAVPGLERLPEQLLGHILVAPDLATARRALEAARLQPGPLPARAVTLTGELLHADGTLTVGVPRADSGILSRKSELRELRERAAGHDERIRSTEEELQEQLGQAEALETPIQSLNQEISVLTEESGHLRGRIAQHRQSREGLRGELDSGHERMAGVQRQFDYAEAMAVSARSNAERTAAESAAVELRLEQSEALIRTREHHRVNRLQADKDAQIALAQSAERHAALRASHDLLAAELSTRRAECDELGERLAAAGARLSASLLAQLAAGSSAAAAAWDKERAESVLATLGAERDACRAERQGLDERLRDARGAFHQQQSLAHARELRATELRNRRANLCARAREDYDIDLPDAHAQWLAANPGRVPGLPSPHADAAAVEAEADDLRRRLSRLGSVNLDSLRELAEVETRSAELQAQYKDVDTGRKQLLEIIDTINNDSRRLFTETFAAVRSNFQELFRKLFGGGMADVTLEEGADVLEGGIDIVARPPGKELRSISLMSGGERTMTAVALLLAIFRNRPSPFCLLDEVDAALDEANTARLAGCLREFLDRSHFVIITHKKRTMAAADVLHGITMQEAGVSLRLDVRFEDWPDDTEQARAA